jgi:UDP-N-acetylmuramate dehydrogenase
VKAVNAAMACDLRFFILGGGSNILFADEGFDGLVIKDECREYIINGDIISAQSGVLLDSLVDHATSRSFTGFEFAAGIPGTVGGAMWGNAGAFGNSVADILESAVLYDFEEGLKIVDNEYLGFAYRHSRLKINPALVLTASFKLKSGQKAEIADKVNEHRHLRKVKHPNKEGCAGSVFKNIKEPELIPAGKLLEEAGARGLRVGDAEIFERHCNIIVNRGAARAVDVKELADKMQKLVMEKSNILLEYELVILKP